MAIAQDTIITVGSGATEKSFGVSKTLDQYTLDDLKTVGDWAYSAYNDNIYNANIFKVIDRSGTLINIEDTESAIRLSTMPDNKLFTEGFNLQSEGVFFRNVLVYKDNSIVTDWSSYVIYVGHSQLGHLHIVTDIDLQDLKIAIYNTDINAYNPTYTTCKLGVNDVTICPMQLLVTPDNVYLNMALPFNGGRGTAGNINSWLTYRLISYDNPNIKTYTDYKNLRTIDGALTDTLYMAPNGVDFAFENGNQDKTFTSADSIVSMDSYEWGGYRFFRYQLNQSNLDAPYIWHAYAGVKFELDGVTYKPIVSNGMITGYTSDMSEESEWDEWENIKDHVTPSVRPSPTPPTPSSGDDIDSMGFDGMSCSVGGPAKYYIMSYSDIHHLIGDFNTHAEAGTSISNNIISCYVNALDWNWTTGSEAIEIYSGGAQTVAFTSDMNYKVITGYNARDIIGSIDVPRMTNTFYDFSPYSTYEVYVPFCGWVALPDTVAGRHIKIYFETDEATCGCKGRVFFVDSSGNGVTVAEITGSFGAPCPIQVIEGGLYKQAMLSNGLQVIGGMASGIMGGAMGAGALAVSGLSSAMQSLGNCLIAGNTNYGQTIGRAGDASGLMCAGKPYLKITYPPLDEVVNNSMFGHTVGYLCNTVGKLSTFSGFTVCANPHITGVNCTDSEKEEIKRLLEEGVIL